MSAMPKRVIAVVGILLSALAAPVCAADLSTELSALIIKGGPAITQAKLASSRWRFHIEGF